MRPSFVRWGWCIFIGTIARGLVAVVLLLSGEAEVIAGNVKLREQLPVGEERAVGETNRRRMVLGLTPLAIDMKLVACCRDHSSDLIDYDFFAQASPVAGKKTPWDRAKNFGTTASVENIAVGYANGLAVTKGWWYSPGHLKNMMGKGHKRIAFGQQQKHYTQMFGRQVCFDCLNPPKRERSNA